MSRDADGNAIYTEGTIADEMDSWDVYEDSDGNVGLYNGSNEVRIHDLAHVLTNTRAEPTTSELADGEYMLYVADGAGANAAGDFVVARNNSGSIETVVAAAASGFV